MKCQFSPNYKNFASKVQTLAIITMYKPLHSHRKPWPSAHYSGGIRMFCLDPLATLLVGSFHHASQLTDVPYGCC